MHAFINTKEVSINIGKFFRFYPEGTLGSGTPVDKLIIDAAGESKAVRDYHELVNGKVDKISDSAQKTSIQLVDEAQLVKWQYLPVRLGRVSAKLLADELHLHEELAPLAMQCGMLAQKKLGKKHFRVAVVNAFGANLGDTTLGMAALRVAVKVFQEKFKSFELDFFLGPSSHIANQYIINTDPWVQHVLYHSPTLQDFARYDAYFDFTNLINLPKFHDMPTADWYLWWMGLDPAEVDGADKRNRLSIPWPIWQDVAELFKGISGRRVLFNAKASVPLRSFPLDAARKLLRKMLDDDKDLHVLVSHEIDLKHPRLTAVHDKLPTAEHFMALVAQSDAVITVDTFAVHVADAAAVPCVSLFASVPPSSYPYYPLNEGMLIPGGEELPGYKKSKNASDEEWQSMEKDYHKAWSKLNSTSLLKSLKALAVKKKTTQCPSQITLRSGAESKTSFAWKDGAHRFKHVNASKDWQDTHDKLTKYSKVILKQGMSCVQLGAGAPDLSLAVVRTVGALGRVHIVEPRRHCAAMLGLNLANEISTGQVQIHRAMLAKGQKFVQFEAADPFSEVDPAQWGNLRQQEKVSTLKMDEIDLPHCQMLLIQLPMPAGFIIEAAADFIAKHQPSIGLGPIDKEGLRAFVQALHGQDYTVWAESASHDGKSENYCALAFHKDKKINLQGFKQVKI